MTRFIAFKIWGDYAHFKKHYTTTSPLTFEIPPPPTVLGMIAAIIGLGKESYLSHFQDASAYAMAIRIMKPVKKTRWTQNLINTKLSGNISGKFGKTKTRMTHFGEIKGRTQIRIEFLKDPAYMIYFHHDDPAIRQALKERLLNHAPVYSVCLGLSELLAGFEYAGDVQAGVREGGPITDIHTVVPAESLCGENPVSFEHSAEIFRCNYPLFMTPERVVTKRGDIVFERNAAPMYCRVRSYYETEKGERIVSI